MCKIFDTMIRAGTIWGYFWEFIQSHSRQPVRPLCRLLLFSKSFSRWMHKDYPDGHTQSRKRSRSWNRSWSWWKTWSKNRMSWNFYPWATKTVTNSILGWLNPTYTKQFYLFTSELRINHTIKIIPFKGEHHNQRKHYNHTMNTITSAESEIWWRPIW